MKAGADHVIPLAPDVLDMIESQRRWSVDTGFVFPGRGRKKPVSPPAYQDAMKRLGIRPDVLVPHGFRHTTSSFLNEREFVVEGKFVRFSADAIESQLAHATPGVRGRYKVSDHLPERRRMMAAWSLWCAELVADRHRT